MANKIIVTGITPKGTPTIKVIVKTKPSLTDKVVKS
jgi:hypothetical protein